MEENQSLFSLTIDPVTKSHLNDLAWWARFIAITGIILLLLGLAMTLIDVALMDDSLGMVLIVNGSQSTELTPAMRLTTAISSVLFTALLFFPLYFMFLFSGKMKKALARNQQKELNEAFQNLKKTFRYVGIVMILCILLIALVFILYAAGRAV
jgi:hypothetical protein